MESTFTPNVCHTPAYFKVVANFLPPPKHFFIKNPLNNIPFMLSIFKSVMSHVWISFHKSASPMEQYAEDKRRRGEKHLTLGVKDRQEHVPSIRAQPTKPSLHSIVLLESQMPIPKVQEEIKTLLRDRARVWQPGPPVPSPPLQCPGLASFHNVAMETLCQKTHHLQSVKQAACAPQPCEIARMPFETSFLNRVLYGDVRGEEGGSGC